MVDEANRAHEQDIGPRNGAKVVARAWVDPAYRRRLRADCAAAIAELGFGGGEGHHLQVAENTDDVDYVVVFTLCSCYPWPVFGPPPGSYKDPAYRAGVRACPRRSPGRHQDRRARAVAGRAVPARGLHRPVLGTARDARVTGTEA